MKHSLTVNDQTTLLQWAAIRANPDDDWPGSAHAIGVLKEGRICAVLVTVQTYRGVVDAHIASDGDRTWATRFVLGWLFGFMFVLLDAHRVQIAIDPKNKGVVRFALSLGFIPEGTMANGRGGNKPALLMAMTPDGCKWIKEETNGS